MASRPKMVNAPAPVEEQPPPPPPVVVPPALCTVTITAADVVLPPFESTARAMIAWLPSGTSVDCQKACAGEAVELPTTESSTLSSILTSVAPAPDAAVASISTLPDTVAPFAGAVIETVGGAVTGKGAFETAGALPATASVRVEGVPGLIVAGLKPLGLVTPVGSAPAMVSTMLAGVPERAVALTVNVLLLAGATLALVGVNASEKSPTTARSALAVWKSEADSPLTLKNDSSSTVALIEA